MKITHLTETEEAWPYFYDFCIQSKPYDFCNLPSRHLRDHEIRRAFEDFKTYEGELIDNIEENQESE